MVFKIPSIFKKKLIMHSVSNMDLATFYKTVVIYVTWSIIKINKSSGATALESLGRQIGHRRSAKLVPTFADRGVSRGQRNDPHGR